MPWRWSRAASRRAAGERRLRRVVPAGRGQQRVDARRVARQLHVLRERARMLARDRRDDVARPVGRQLRAQHDRAAREVAAEPRGAAHHLVRVELVRLGAQLLQERAAQVLLDLLLGLLDRDLGQRGDSGQVEELGRLRGRGRARLAEQHDRADHLVARRDRDLREDPRRDLRRAVLGAIAGVAAQRPEVARAAGRRHRRTQARDDDRHVRARGVGGELGDASEAVAPQHGVDHLQVDGPQPLDERHVAHGLGRRHRDYATRSAASAAAPGCACSVSSPDSPVRIR